MMPENGSGQPPSPTQHDDYYYDDDQPGQEISFDDTGNTIVAGNRIDIESDDGSEIHIQHRHHNHDDDDDDDDSNIPLRTAKSPSGRGGTCHWLKTSSSKVKYVLGFGAILFVAFVAVMAVGLVQMSSSSTSSDGGDGSVSSAQLGDEVDGGIGSSENGVSHSPSPTMAPIMETRTSSAPTNLYEIFPVEDAVIQITLPNDMEGLVHTLGGDANDSDVENWKDMEVILEDTISSTLQEQLPDEYVVGAVQIVQFDDFVPSYSKRTRLLQNDGDNTHTVIYSTSVSVNCANSDCSTASVQIEDAVTYLSTMEFELTSTETTPLTDPPTEAATTTRPTGSPTDPPSKASTGVPTVDSTDINTIIVDEETSMPTSKATSMPSLEPSSAKPTTSPTSKPTTVPRLEITTSCSADEPCGMCKGQCQDDTQCQTGLQCFKRIYLEYIPGCIGPGNQGQNYCYDPFAEGSGSEILLSTEDAKCDDKRRCEKCFGDCNSDDECEKDLYCYRRAGFELVPGCAGQGVQGRDYCFDPEDIDGGDYR